MQTFGLPRQITRGAALASRLRDAERSEAARRRDAVRRWQGARRQGLSAADAAAAVGVSRATLYRWAKRAEPRSRRPRRPRRSRWTPDLVAAVQRIRGDCPQVGAHVGQGQDRHPAPTRRARDKREHRRAYPQDPDGPGRGHPSPRRNRPRAARRARPYAGRLPKGRKAGTPGEIVQLDTLTVSSHPGRPAIERFAARDPVAKWTRARAWCRAAAHNAQVRRACAAPPGPRSRPALDKLQAGMPVSPSSASTGGSTPSPTSPTPSDRAKPLEDEPQPGTLPNTRPTNPLHLIGPEPGRGLARRGGGWQDRARPARGERHSAPTRCWREPWE